MTQSQDYEGSLKLKVCIDMPHRRVSKIISNHKCQKFEKMRIGGGGLIFDFCLLPRKFFTSKIVFEIVLPLPTPDGFWIWNSCTPQKIVFETVFYR